jgi:hypothetical protein
MARLHAQTRFFAVSREPINRTNAPKSGFAPVLVFKKDGELYIVLPGKLQALEQ